MLKRTVVKPAGIVPDPVDAAYVANRLTALTHELANLLDGSLRVINMARKPGSEETPEHVSKHIETVYACDAADGRPGAELDDGPSPGRCRMACVRHWVRAGRWRWR